MAERSLVESPELSIIIPAFNESHGIQAVLSELCAEPALDSAEIVVVDDGSTDDTCERVRQFPRVLLIRHSANMGYGAAISQGVRACQGRYVIWFDADGQHQVQDLLVVAKTMILENLDYCIGVREDSSYQAPGRALGKQVLKLAVVISVGHAVKDFNSGLRGFKREVIKRYLHLLPRGFGASTTTTLLMIERGYLGKEVPITARNRIGVSSVNPISDGFKTLLLVLRIFLLFKALFFFGGIGLVCILVGTIYGVAKALSVGLGFPVLSSILIIFGIQAIFFGLLADQISALRREKFE
jgi:glycosyltransferase involved in cell wall biosynthesis